MRGSSPLQAALRRLVADELTQHTDNRGACSVIWCGKFLRFHLFVSGGTGWIETGIPPVLLGLALLTYAGVRFLTEGCSGLAGCGQGNHAARLALYDILQKSHELHPSTTTAQWVDDLAQRTQSSPSEVVNKAVAALHLVRDLQEDKLAVASKSVVIATTPNNAKQVVSALAKHDIHIQEASQAKDLSLDMSRARKSMRRTMSKRRAKAGRRTIRCARFHKSTSKQSRSRWGTGAWAQKAYGTAAVGAPPTWIKQAQTRAAEAAQCVGRDRCLTTTIAPLQRRSSNPDPVQSHQAVAHILGVQPQTQAQDWQSLGKKCDSDDGEESYNQMEVRAGTPVSCHGYTQSWKDPEGDRWSLKTGGEGIDDWGFWQAFQASIEGHLWEKAARHELGAGLDGGPDLTTLFKHDKFLVKRACMQPEACCWQRQRRRAGLRHLTVRHWTVHKPGEARLVDVRRQLAAKSYFLPPPMCLQRAMSRFPVVRVPHSTNCWGHLLARSTLGRLRRFVRSAWTKSKAMHDQHQLY